jgi:hypothetical protein
LVGGLKKRIMDDQDTENKNIYSLYAVSEKDIFSRKLEYSINFYNNFIAPLSIHLPPSSSTFQHKSTLVYGGRGIYVMEDKKMMKKKANEPFEIMKNFIVIE